MRTNEQIVNERMETYNAVMGPRVGDWIRETNGRMTRRMTRATHDWNYGVQTNEVIQHGGSEHGSFYLGDYGASYSGGLDTGIHKADLRLTDDIKKGDVWIFDKDWARAGGGVTYSVDFRVYEVAI